MIFVNIHDTKINSPAVVEVVGAAVVSCAPLRRIEIALFADFVSVQPVLK